MQKTLLILFVKAPGGRDVKTRLKSVLTLKKRGQLYEAFILDTLALSASLPTQRALACTPDITDPFFTRCQKEHATLLVQQEGDTLGDRMKNAFQWAFSLGFTKVIIIGSDSPTLPPSFLEEAFKQLHTVPIVLGPATDGGYYLIGARPPLPDIFSGIPWGASTVFLETIRRLRRFHLLPFWYDVDRPDDLAFLKEHLAYLRRKKLPFAQETGNRLKQL